MLKLRPLLAATMLCAGGSALAESHWELGGGYNDEVGGESSFNVMAAYVLERSERLEYEFALAHIGSRDDGFREINPSTNLVSASARYFFFGGGFFGGFGVAFIDDESEVLSSFYQFSTQFGYRFTDRFQVSVRHLSNASFRGENRGDNLLTLSVLF